MNTNLKYTRATNLDFLRWRLGGHNSLAKRLSGTLNRKDLSDYALGSKSIPTYIARAIEDRLGLMRSWLDRTNIDAIESSEVDFDLFTLVQKAPPEVKEAIRTILNIHYQSRLVPP